MPTYPAAPTPHSESFRSAHRCDVLCLQHVLLDGDDFYPAQADGEIHVDLCVAIDRAEIIAVEAGDREGRVFDEMALGAGASDRGRRQLEESIDEAVDRWRVGLGDRACDCDGCGARNRAAFVNHAEASAPRATAAQQAAADAVAGQMRAAMSGTTTNP